MTTKRGKTVEHSRSAITGRFVREEYARTHPKTTVTEHRAAKPATPPKKGGK